MKRISILLTLIAIFWINIGNAQEEEKISKNLSIQINDNQGSNEFSVWIFFTDKGESISKKLNEAENKLNENALKRRKKTFKNKSTYATFYDIPIKQEYLNETNRYINKLRQKSKWLNAVSAEVSSENINKIANMPFVKKIDIVRKGKINNSLEIDFSNNIRNPFEFNTKYDLNYGASLVQMEQINVPVFHELGYSADNVVVCVLDAGFNNLEHQSFENMNIIGAYDFVNDDDNVDDEDDMGNGNHGTMTLSTIGGFYEGQLIGPAYNADYVLAKTENTDSETQVEEDNWVAAIEWAEDNYGPDVSSTSLGYINFDDGTGYSASELDGNTSIITIAADIAASLGIIVVNSAGNSGPGATTIGAPADGDSVLAVGAVDSNGIITGFSSHGPTGDGRIKPEVMAMGSGVYVASTSGNEYTTASGTSFSGPLTGGVAALLVGAVPSASNMDIFEALKMTANNADNPDNQYGWGIINVLAAYNYLRNPIISHIPLNDSENFDGPYTVVADVESLFDILNNSPVMYYRLDNGSWETVIMTQQKNGTYTAEIPGNGNEAEYDYYITAENSETIVSFPEDAPNYYLSFMVRLDNTAPEILHNTIDEYYKNLWGQVQIIAQITDNMDIDTENSFVEWKINDIEQDNFYFTLNQNDIYSGYFPFTDLDLGDKISYRINVSDNAINTNVSLFPENGFHNFFITDKISFEQNKFVHNWNLSGDNNWFVTDTEYQSGTFSAKSGDIDDGQSSKITIIFNCDDAGTISFFKKVSCEDDSNSDNYDFLKFSINGEEQNRWDAEVDWSIENYYVDAGTYTIEWEYSKDGSVSDGEDCAWIDNITLPIQSVIYNNINKIKQANYEIKIYPNPANDILYFVFNDNLQQKEIEIYNINGQKLYEFKTNNNSFDINTSNYKQGIYFCKIKSENRTDIKKIIIQK